MLPNHLVMFYPAMMTSTILNRLSLLLPLFLFSILPVGATVSLLKDYRNPVSQNLPDGSVLKGEFSLSGFELKSAFKSEAGDCELIKEIKYLVLVAVELRSSAQIPKWIKECHDKGGNPLLSDLLLLQRTRGNLDTKNIRKRPYGKQLLKIAAIKQRVGNRNKKLLASISNWEKVKDTDLPILERLKLIKSILDQTDNFFLQKIFNALAGVVQKNKIIVKAELKDLFDNVFFRGVYASALEGVSDFAARETFKKNMLGVLVHIFSFIDNLDLKILLHLYLDEFFPQLIKSESNLSLRYSVERFNKVVYNPYWGLDHPITILPILNRKTKNSEVQSYIFKLNESPIQKSTILEYTFLSYYNFLSDERVRKRVSKKIESLYFSSNLSEKYLAIELLEQASIRKELKNINKEFLKPIFSLKRRFFLEVLSQGIGVDLAIFNLLGLGDIRLNYLWWIIL